MARFTTTSFVTASVSAGGFLNHNEVISVNSINIYKITIVPSIVGSTSQAQLYSRDTFLAADRVWGVNPFTGTAFDPVQKDTADVITEANLGFVAPYEDEDTTSEIHIKLINDDGQAKTYTVTIIWDAPGTTVAAFTQGSVPFADSGGLLAQDNANLFWDDSNNRLGIGTASPSKQLHVVGTSQWGDTLTIAKDQGSAFTGVSITNNQNASSGDAKIRLITHTTGGDPHIEFNVSGVKIWSIGVDNTDGEKFKISEANAIGTNDIMEFNPGGAIEIFADFIFGQNYLQGEEISDAAAPAVDQGRIYFRDTGGKTELVARFATGAIQQIAIEP